MSAYRRRPAARSYTVTLRPVVFALTVASIVAACFGHWAWAWSLLFLSGLSFEAKR